jgi:hypothetical protein
MSINVLLASPVATGKGRESTDGTSMACKGEVGREVRFTSRRPPFTELDFCYCGDGFVAIDGKPSGAEVTGTGGVGSTSWNEDEFVE